MGEKKLPISREIIQEIEKAGLGLEEFFDISIRAMQSIKDRLSLQ